MKTTKVLTAATILALPMLGACDSSPTGPVVENEIFAAPQMGLGTSPISSEALDYFGKDRLLTAVSVEEVRRWGSMCSATSTGAQRPRAACRQVSPEAREARWLEPHDAALLLEATRT